MVIGLEEVPCAAEDAATVAASALQGGGGNGDHPSAEKGAEGDDEEYDDDDEQMEQFLTLEHLCERFKGIDNDATLVMGVGVLLALSPCDVSLISLLLVCAFILGHPPLKVIQGKQCFSKTPFKRKLLVSGPRVHLQLPLACTGLWRHESPQNVQRYHRGGVEVRMCFSRRTS